MRELARSALIVSAVAVLCIPVSASEYVLRLAPSETEVGFDLGATGHDVHGVFHLPSGEVRFDPETGSASGRIVIDATEAETGNRKRDKTMHKKVIRSVEFPVFVFRPDRIDGPATMDGESEFTLQGTLEVLGQEHRVDMLTKATFSGDRVAATTHFSVPFVDWGMHDPSFLFLRVAKVVEVTVTAGGTLDKTAVATASGRP